jgi:hypothetical protein
LPALESAIPMALATMVTQMRHPYRHFNGLPAIVRFCRQVPKWNLAMQGDELRRNLALTAFMLEKAGTGGGAFRNLYSRYLSEAGDMLDAPELRAAALTYRTLAAQWRDVAGLLDESVDQAGAGIFSPGDTVRTRMTDIADNEARGIDLIASWLKEEPTLKAFL